jgi:hypothetical protein
MPSSAPFELGREYDRQTELHDVYGGQRYGGISTPKRFPFIFLFSGAQGANYGYADEELADGDLIYYGEGASGPMQMIGGHRAIRYHVEEDRTLHLFKAVRTRIWQYAGEFAYVEHEIRPDAPGEDQKRRDAIVFRLRPVGPDGHSDSDDVADAVAAVTAIARGRGYSSRLSPAERKAIELRGMDLAIAHFESLGFDVDDVSSNQSYDLRCTSDETHIDVEVKGTTTSGEVVLLTANEVQHALSSYPNTALAIVQGIVLDRSGATPSARGGLLEVRSPWRPLDTDLRPIAYRYQPTDVAE